jgi:hypothetical protein
MSTAFDWEFLAKQAIHPTKLRILAAMSGDTPVNKGKKPGKKHEEEVPGWSPNMISKEINEPLGNVSYHVRRMLDMGYLRATGAFTVRGTLEHFYVLQKRVLNDEWKGQA